MSNACGCGCARRQNRGCRNNLMTLESTCSAPVETTCGCGCAQQDANNSSSSSGNETWQSLCGCQAPENNCNSCGSCCDSCSCGSGNCCDSCGCGNCCDPCGSCGCGDCGCGGADTSILMPDAGPVSCTCRSACPSADCDDPDVPLVRDCACCGCGGIAAGCRLCCDQNGNCRIYPCTWRNSFWPEFTHPRWLCCKDLYNVR